MKRYLTILLVLCLLPAFALAEVTVSDPGVYPITTDDVELTVWTVRTPQTQDVETLAQTVWYEDFSGVKVKWVTVPSDEMDTMFNLAISSDEYPDVFLYSADSAELTNLAEDGVIIPLNNLLDQAPYFKQMLDELDMWDAVTAPNGDIYSMLASVYLVQNSMLNKVWVLRDWLAQYTEATGKGMPETTEDFFDLLSYFRDHDMNGNGDTTDELPLIGNFQAWREGSDPLFYMLGAYLYCPTNFLVSDEEQNVRLAVTEDAFRDGLKYANRLFKEGLIAEDTYVQSLTQMRQITSVYKDNAVAGVVAGMSPLRVVNLSAEEGKVGYADYVAIPPIAGPEGVRVTDRRAVNQMNLRCFISTSCKNPEVAIKWLDYWCSKEGSRWCSYLGQENVHWEWADEPSFAGDPKSVKSLVTWTFPQDVYWTITWFAGYYISEDMFTSKAASSTYTDNELAGNLAEQAYMPYSRLSEFPQIVWCEDNDLAIEKAELDKLFQDRIISACTEYTLGSRDIYSDADWMAFQDELNQMGLDHYLEVIRAYYFGK